MYSQVVCGFFGQNLQGFLQISSANKLFFFFLSDLNIFSFPCLIALARTSSIILNKSVKSGNPGLRGKAFSFSPLINTIQNHNVVSLHTHQDGNYKIYIYKSPAIKGQNEENQTQSEQPLRGQVHSPSAVQDEQCSYSGPIPAGQAPHQCMNLCTGPLVIVIRVGGDGEKLEPLFSLVGM